MTCSQQSNMVCCFSHSVLTKAERDAIARLREQRAQGRIPTSAAHTTTTDRMDPVVSFYNQNSHSTQLQHHQRNRRVKPPPAPPQLLPSSTPSPLTSASGSLLSKGRNAAANGAGSSSKLMLNGLSSSGPKKWKSRDTNYVYGSSISSEGQSSSGDSSNSNAAKTTAEQRKKGVGFVNSTSSPLLLRKGIEKITSPSSSILQKNPISRKDSNKDIHDKLESERDRHHHRHHHHHHQPQQNKMTKAFLNTTSNVANFTSTKRRATESNLHLEREKKNHNVMERLKVKDNASALLNVMKTLNLFNKASEDVQNDAERIKGKDDDQVGSDTENNDDVADRGKHHRKLKHNNLGRIAWAGKKKLDDMMSRLNGGSHANAERFVIKPRPELSDLAEESNNDAYFQELMRGD